MVKKTKAVFMKKGEKIDRSGRVRVSASKVKRLLECGGSHFLESKIKKEEQTSSSRMKAVAETGISIHSVMERILKSNLKIINKKEIKLNQFISMIKPSEEIEPFVDGMKGFFSFLDDYVKSHGGYRNHNFYVEKLFEHHCKGFITLSARIDFISINEDEVVVWDFKSGGAGYTSYDNPQLILSCYLLEKAFARKVVGKAFKGVIVNLRRPDILIKRSDYPNSLLERFFIDLENSLNEKKFVSNSECKYCPVILECPLINEVKQRVRSIHNVLLGIKKEGRVIA